MEAVKSVSRSEAVRVKAYQRVLAIQIVGVSLWFYLVLRHIRHGPIACILYMCQMDTPWIHHRLSADPLLYMYWEQRQIYYWVTLMAVSILYTDDSAAKCLLLELPNMGISLYGYITLYYRPLKHKWTFVYLPVCDEIWFTSMFYYHKNHCNSADKQESLSLATTATKTF